MVKQIGSQEFEQEVLSSQTPAVVYFTAPWCGPCKMFSPLIEEVASEYAHKVTFVKLNVDDASGIAARYMVMSIPTLVLFKDGNPCNKRTGFSSKNDVVDFIVSYL